MLIRDSIHILTMVTVSTVKAYKQFTITHHDPYILVPSRKNEFLNFNIWVDSHVLNEVNSQAVLIIWRLCRFQVFQQKKTTFCKLKSENFPILTETSNRKVWKLQATQFKKDKSLTAWTYNAPQAFVTTALDACEDLWH